jgi:hypothetical protein
LDFHFLQRAQRPPTTTILDNSKNHSSCCWYERLALWLWHMACKYSLDSHGYGDNRGGCRHVLHTTFSSVHDCAQHAHSHQRLDRCRIRKMSSKRCLDGLKNLCAEQRASNETHRRAHRLRRTPYTPAIRSEYQHSHIAQSTRQPTATQLSATPSLPY